MANQIERILKEIEKTVEKNKLMIKNMTVRLEEMEAQCQTYERRIEASKNLT
jgi:hypothetical protein